MLNISVQSGRPPAGDTTAALRSTGASASCHRRSSGRPGSRPRAVGARRVGGSEGRRRLLHAAGEHAEEGAGHDHPLDADHRAVGRQGVEGAVPLAAVDGRDIAVSGVVVVPTSATPKAGRPVVTWAHGTTGMGDQCAPLKQADAASAIPYVKQLVDAGYVVAATDYEGLGTPGVHPYLVGESEGRSVLDVARAARGLNGSGASDRVLVAGHSQGGQSALFAGELAASYSPELDMLGVAVGVRPGRRRAVPQGPRRAQAHAHHVLRLLEDSTISPDFHRDILGSSRWRRVPVPTVPRCRRRRALVRASEPSRNPRPRSARTT